MGWEAAPGLHALMLIRRRASALIAVKQQCGGIVAAFAGIFRDRDFFPDGGDGSPG